MKHIYGQLGMIGFRFLLFLSFYRNIVQKRLFLLFREEIMFLGQEFVDDERLLKITAIK